MRRVFLFCLIFACVIVPTRPVSGQDKRWYEHENYIKCDNQLHAIQTYYQEDKSLLGTPERLRKELKKLDKLASVNDDLYIARMPDAINAVERYYWTSEKFRTVIQEYIDQTLAKQPDDLSLFDHYFRFVFQYAGRYEGLTLEEFPAQRKKSCEILVRKWAEFEKKNPHYDPEAPENQIPDEFVPPDIPANRKIYWNSGHPTSEITDKETLKAYNAYREKRDKSNAAYRRQLEFDILVEQYKDKFINYILYFYSVEPHDTEELSALLLKHQCTKDFSGEVMKKLEARMEMRNQEHFRFWFDKDDKIICDGAFKSIGKNVRIFQCDMPEEDVFSVCIYRLKRFRESDQETIQKMAATMIDENNDQTEK